jgi:hypothetical protein
MPAWKTVLPAWTSVLGVRQWRSRARLGDPFAVLDVQCSLARLEREITSLRRTGSRDFAQAHHLRAALIAYDQLLVQACRMAGVEPPTQDRPEAAVSGAELNGSRPEDPGGEVARVLAVVALDARGWRW